MTDNTMYAHTRAYISHLAREYPASPTTTTTQHYDLNDAGDGDGGEEGGKVANPALVKKVVRLLDEEDEDGLKLLLQQTFSIDESDPSLMEQVVLDLMHKHKDDIQGVPFVYLSASSTKRPISRPSSRASSYRRPETPTLSSSPLAKSLSLRRPHTPIASPLSAGLHAPAGIIGQSSSPGSSPTMANHPLGGGFIHSGPPSPLTSPHFLNAKAIEFRPIAVAPRPGSASGGRNETPSPDLWAHRAHDIITPNSPRRSSGSLAIASPLSGEGYYPRPSSSLNRSNSGLRKSSTRYGSTDDDGGESKSYPRLDDEDQQSQPGAFSPFSRAPPMNMPKSTANTHLNLFDDNPTAYAYPTHLRSVFTADDPEELSPNGLSPTEMNDPTGAASDGMTPFEVLHSVFGSSVPPATLEEALTKNGYEFEAAMAWLIDQRTGTNTSPSSPRQAPAPPVPVPGSGGRVMTVSRDVLPILRGAGGGGAQTPPGGNPQYFGQRVAVATGGRVCRYYLAGECRRSDCRFSHDIERALCRFWLRGQCMKGEQCEFLHTLPQDIDIGPLTGAMAGQDLNNESGGGRDSPTSTPVDAFPSLGVAQRRPSGAPAGGAYDPSRTRFAAAVKKAPMVSVTNNHANALSSSSRLGVRRIPGDRTTPATPRPSPRLKLRPPSLLPTLPTGKAINDLYMSYRSRAIEFGGQRNVALTRAAEAWKRGDGAAAKHWSRQAHELNDKMAKETAEAADKLVKERAKASMDAVTGRETSWSDDPYDRGTRGKVAGAGMGVLLGVASVNVGGVGMSGAKLTAEERTECLLDLHGLHSSEGVEVLELFLLALEREHFLGLAYVVVGEEKHTGTQDPNRGASRLRLASGVKEFLHRWQYPWNERDGVVCIDPLTHAS